MEEPKYHYLYCPLFSSDEFILQWKQEKMNYLQENDFMFKKKILENY